MVCARATILRVVDELLASQTKLHSFKFIQEAEIIKTELPMRTRSPGRGARVREVKQARNRIGFVGGGSAGDHLGCRERVSRRKVSDQPAYKRASERTNVILEMPTEREA